ncbi:unnamed protein product, partial [Rotaria sp. Silwood1]
MTKASYSLIHESIINIAPIFSTTRVYTTLSVYYIRKKINATDLKYLSKTAAPMKEVICEKGRPPNERYPFQKQHPQTTTHLMMKYSQSHVPILYGPQIPRRDRDDTRERYSRALLTLFVPWRTVADLCDVNQTWEDAFKSRQHLISIHSWKIIENIQLLHECKKDRDEHLLQVIAEAQTDNDAIDPILLPANHDVHGECDMDDSEDLLELLRHLDEHTSTAINTTKKSTENKYIEETIATVENVGRFTHLNTYQQSSLNESTDKQLVSFVSATSDLVRLNTKWQKQLRNEKERVRRNLMNGSHEKDWDGTLDLNAAKDAVITMRTEDLRYLQLLERLRHGQCTYDDYELLLTRVVGQPSVASLHDSPWNQAPILVFRNEVRTQLNHKAAIHNATQSGNLPIVCVAQDTCKGKPIEDPTL